MERYFVYKFSETIFILKKYVAVVLRKCSPSSVFDFYMALLKKRFINKLSSTHLLKPLELEGDLNG